MNNTQKRFYIYKYNQKLPVCLRSNLKTINIHQVINSKVPSERRSEFPLQFTYRRRKDNIKNFVYHALYNQDIKMLRITIERFPCELLLQINIIPKGEHKTKYIPFYRFKGWQIKLDNLLTN